MAAEAQLSIAESQHRTNGFWFVFLYLFTLGSSKSRKVVRSTSDFSPERIQSDIYLKHPPGEELTVKLPYWMERPHLTFKLTNQISGSQSSLFKASLQHQQEHISCTMLERRNLLQSSPVIFFFLL